MAGVSVRARGPRRPEDDAIFRSRRRERRLLQEIAVRVTLGLAFLALNELFDIGTGPRGEPIVRTATLLALLLNLPYYLVARLGWRLRAQAYGRMLIDVALLTLGLYGAGGLAAAPYVAVYAIVGVYGGTVLSSLACVTAILTATASYLLVAILQEKGVLPINGAMPPNAWAMAVYNLLLVNVVGALTAILSEAYRQSRRRLATLYQELERAYDGSSKLNAEIQRSARLNVLGEVVAGVTHEIRNALQGSVLALEMVRQEVAAAVPTVLGELDRIEHGCETALRIVRNVLHTARHASEEKGPVSLAEIARRTVDLRGYELRREGIAIQLDFPREYPLVIGNPFRLQQVLLNLVTNAQEAIRAGGRTRTIALVGSAGEGRAVVEVHDTGPGIAESALPHLFEPFFTTKPNGTGLGLAISADIVRECGGDLSARNRPEGGAIFRVSLPLAPATPSDAPPVASVDRLPAPARTRVRVDGQAPRASSTVTATPPSAR
jgi:signal transduction histidine kinase